MGVGDGPARDALERAFPDVRFFGMKCGRELVHYYQQADVFVFPSRTDTFGLVLIEAMACGTPVAAFPVAGPIDVVTDARAGVLSGDLRSAALAALELRRDDVRAFGARFSWQAATRQFVENLHPRDRAEERQMNSDEIATRSTTDAPPSRSRFDSHQTPPFFTDQ